MNIIINQSAPSTTQQLITNDDIAAALERVAQLLDAQEANPLRVRAYCVAAANLRSMQRSAATIYAQEGLAGLQALPGIGVSIAQWIAQMINTGRFGLLEQLQGETTPEPIVATVPGIGAALADHIHTPLDIESLYDRENANYGDRLDALPGCGPRPLRSVRESLAGRFNWRPFAAPQPKGTASANQPTVDELLDVDAEYCHKARAGQLPRITPRCFNSTGAAWLPILHTERGATHYTALYSNTVRAHEFGMTQDWVVIYRDDQNGHGQWTVVTARHGPLQGRRIVSGREAECQAYYMRERTYAAVV
ncbi:MAG: hypothetical protein H6641_02115 [Caldilineaceae bacterium]|nr:hypothetical protein [Caldilineaceae bacterium]